MSKSTLTAMLAQRHGLTEDASRAIVDDVFFYIEQALKDQKKVSFTNFGSFKLVERQRRTASDKSVIGEKNTENGSDTLIGVRFVPSKQFKEEFNK